MDNIKFIPNNHLFVTPLEQETRFLFTPYLVSCPYRAVRPEEMYASILFADRSLAGIPTRPEQVYSAFIKGAQIWWDPVAGIKDLIILLDSPELEARRNEVLEASGSKSANAEYSPHIALAFDIPNSTIRNRWWVNQVIQDFSTKHKDRLIRFSGETIHSSTGSFPIDDSNSQTINIQQPTL